MIERDTQKINDGQAIKLLEQIKKIPSIVQIKCLPGIHYKKGVESPSQFVAATKNTIVPHLTEPSLNCGMGIIKTSLNKNDFNEKKFKKFSDLMRREVSPRFTRLQTMLLWLGIKKRPHLKYDLTRKEFEDVMRDGPKAILQKYGLPESSLNNIEYNGYLFNEQEKKEFKPKEIIPRSSYKNARQDMGYGFGGNHFLEIYAVEEIKDWEVAGRWGIYENQILLFYHGGGGHATYNIGRYFARRGKNKLIERIILFILKLLFHFSSFEGLKNFKIRWHAYFSKKSFPAIPADSDEGKRLMRASKAAMNFGYAFRLAMLKRVKDALNELFPQQKIQAETLFDSSHNSITEEALDGKKVIVHRHDVAKIFENKPVMIAGFHTQSYLGTGTNNARESIYSYPPSAGKLIKNAKQTENLIHVYRKTKEGTSHKQIKQMTSEELYKMANFFEKNGMIKPVALLKPLAIIKGY